MTKPLRAFVFALATVAASAATIRIDPPSSLTLMGGSADMSVVVADVTDLYAYQFDLAFDASLLSASEPTEGAFLGTGGATFFVPGVVDNTLGTITFTLNTLLGPVPGVSGGGSLATITFSGNAVGTSAITVSNVILLDSSGADIAADLENGSVRVVVPEPGSALLIVSGACAAALLRKRLMSPLFE